MYFSLHVEVMLFNIYVLSLEKVHTKVIIVSITLLFHVHAVGKKSSALVVIVVI